MAEIGVRMAPIHRALAEAAVSDRDCAALRAEIDARRASNMRLLAADLRTTGEVRADLTDDEVADIVWSMNAPEYRALLVGERGWSAERFGTWLADAWTARCWSLRARRTSRRRVPGGIARATSVSSSRTGNCPVSTVST